MKALVLGASGATGKDLVDCLLNNPAYSDVTIFVRRAPDRSHPRLKIHVINFDLIDSWKDLVQGDVLFSCLGTTLKSAGSKSNQWKVDYEYQYRFAEQAKFNDVRAYVLVSSAGANTGSLFFYTRMKGKLEQAVKELGFQKTLIFNPPLLLRKNTNRSSEWVASKIISFFNKAGLLKRQEPMPTETLAQAMVVAAKTCGQGIWNFNRTQIIELLEAFKRV